MLNFDMIINNNDMIIKECEQRVTEIKTVKDSVIKSKKIKSFSLELDSILKTIHDGITPTLELDIEMDEDIIEQCCVACDELQNPYRDILEQLKRL